MKRKELSSPIPPDVNCLRAYETRAGTSSGAVDSGQWRDFSVSFLPLLSPVGRESKSIDFAEK